MRFNQVSVLDLRGHTPWVVISKVLHNRFLGMPSTRVPAEVKRAVFASLAAKAGGEPLSNGVAVLHGHGHQELLWACESRSVTHVHRPRVAHRDQPLRDEECRGDNKP